MDYDSKLRAARIYSRIVKLLALDSITTDVFTQKVAFQSNQDSHMLRTRVLEMEGHLHCCARDSKWISEQVFNKVPESTLVIEKAIASTQVDAHSLRVKELPDSGELLLAVHRAAIKLPLRLNSDIKYLRNQLAVFDLEQVSEGDLPKETLCLLYGVGLGVGILVENPSIIIGAVYKIAETCF